MIISKGCYIFQHGGYSCGLCECDEDYSGKICECNERSLGIILALDLISILSVVV